MSYLEMQQDDSISTLFSVTMPGLPLETHCNYYFYAVDEHGAEAFSGSSEFDVIYWFPTFYTTPIVDSISVTESSTITVKLGRVIDLFTISMDILFDNTIVELDTLIIPESSIWGNGEPLLLFQRFDGGVTVGIGLWQTPEIDNITGFGPLFNIVLIGTGVGSTNVDFDSVYILDEEGVENRYLELIRTNPATIHVE